MSSSASAVRILLANHQPIVRSGLRILLEHEAEFQIVAEAANGREALALAEFRRPAIVLLEIELPEVKGIAVAKLLSSASYAPRIIFVTARTDIVYVIEAFRAGARGFVAGDSASMDLAMAIRAVAAGGLFVSPEIRVKLAGICLSTEAVPEPVSRYLKQNC